MKILIIGATHGNETLGVELYQELLQSRSPLLEHTEFHLANPRAYAHKARYMEQDLNRSYKNHTESYESLRAQEVATRIQRCKYDLVLDIHTTRCIQPTSLILYTLDGVAKRRFIRASHVRHILLVNPLDDILALGDTVVGYEVSENKLPAQGIQDLIGDMTRYINNTNLGISRSTYTMKGKIYKKDISPDTASTFKNFSPHPLGFVPVLTGSNSYIKNTDYIGFKTALPEEIEV